MKDRYSRYLPQMRCIRRSINHSALPVVADVCIILLLCMEANGEVGQIRFLIFRVPAVLLIDEGLEVNKVQG